MSRTDAALDPASAELADGAARWASAYVHVPFCARICPYCDFAVVEGQDDLADRYHDALVREIAGAPDWRPLDAIYVGGGTPSRFGAERLAGTVTALRDRHGLAEGSEVSLEANPEDWTPALAEALRSAGFDRVSFGGQSFNDEVLAVLGRRHTPGRIAEAVSAARSAGFRSVSIDLIFGTPGESLESWRRTVQSALDLEPDHVSCYALTVERGTPLGRAVAAGATAPDPDLQASQYELADQLLSSSGYVRYEVSNWARPGHHCRYNLAVWAQGRFQAFGNGAHGFDGELRYRNVRRLDAYLSRVEEGGEARAGGDPVTGWAAEIDRLFVGLRRVAGVGHGPGVQALLDSRDGARLVAAGVVDHDGRRLRVVRPLLTDEAERAVLDLADPSP